MTLGLIKTLLSDNCTTQAVRDKAPLFLKLVQDPGFERQPDIEWNRKLILRMVEILELPKLMIKCLGLAEVISKDDDDDDDENDYYAAAHGQPHVIENDYYAAAHGQP